jgi:MGT family glycosyltransferase
LNIVYTSRHFQPLSETFDDRFQFVGPSLTYRNETADFPWEQVRHRIVIYVSLGTLFNTDVAFYKHCFQAFECQDCQVILSVGANITRESLGAAPTNFIVQTHVPQLEVLRRSTIFVTHGGMNSVSESLYYGVPVIVVPQMSEQALVGRRVEEIGVGLYVAREDLTADTLRQSAQRLLSEDIFRQQAAVLSESFQTAGGATRAADAILRFTTAWNEIAN